jgi:hypothetical protein
MHGLRRKLDSRAKARVDRKLIEKGNKMVKAILAINLLPGVEAKEYEEWLHEKHLRELLAIPGLRKLVFNTVEDTVVGTARPFRIVEQHYDDMEAYQRSRAWLEKNPISTSRGFLTDFVFFVVCTSEEFQAG